MDVLIPVERQAKLREPSIRSGGRFAHVLNGREQQPYHDGDNRYDDQELGEGETASAHVPFSFQGFCCCPLPPSVPLPSRLLHERVATGQIPAPSGRMLQ
jgi:hypothetical protein